MQYRSGRRRRKKPSRSGPSSRLIIGLSLLSVILVVGLVLLGLKLFPNAYGPDEPPPFSTAQTQPVVEDDGTAHLSVQMMARCTLSGNSVEPTTHSKGAVSSDYAVFVVTVSSKRSITIDNKIHFDFEADSAVVLQGKSTCNGGGALPSNVVNFAWTGNALSFPVELLLPDSRTRQVSNGHPQVFNLVLKVDEAKVVEGSMAWLTYTVNNTNPPVSHELETPIAGSLYVVP